MIAQGILLSCLLVLLNGVQRSSAINRPTFIEPCSRADKNVDDCLTRSAQIALPFILKGDKRLKIPALNPLHVPLVDLVGAQGFHLQLKDIKVHGLGSIVFQSIRSDFVKNQMTVKTHLANLDIVGNYEIKSNSGAIRINGNGPCRISLVGGNYTYNFGWDPQIRKGVEYAKIKNGYLDYTLDRVLIKFDNLFNGDPVLGPSTNTFLNENWEVIHNDLKLPIRKILEKIETDIVTKIFLNIPSNQLILSQ